MSRSAHTSGAPISLGGADVFHLVNDRKMRAEGLCANVCSFVLELAGHLDRDKLTRRIACAQRREPHLQTALHTHLLRPPEWAPAKHSSPPLRWLDEPQHLHAPSTNAVVEGLFANSPLHVIDDKRPWCLEVIRKRDRDVLVFTWFHPFTDAKGAQRIVRWLGSGTDDDLAPLPNDARIRVRPEALEGLTTKELLPLAKKYNEHILRFASKPILSLRGSSPDKPPGTMRFERFVLDPSQTKTLDKSIRARAKLAESSVMIVAAARMLDQALRRRGFAPTHHMIPVPLSLDPKGESGRLFGNHLTMMMFSLERDDLLDERKAIASLTEQQRIIVRDKLDVAMSAALELVRVLPPRLYHGLATLPFGGELSSLIFSNPGVIAIDEFAGIPVVDAYAVPAVVPRPGIEVIVNRHRGALSVLLGYFDGLVPEAEARMMAAELRARLFGETP